MVFIAAAHWALAQQGKNMRLERQFNIRTAKGISVDEPTITTGPAHSALGIKVRFKASQAADGLALHLTPDEAFKLGQRLMAAATSAADN